MRFNVYEEEYLAEKLADAHQRHLYRVANEPSLVEQLALLAWLVLRAFLRGLGHVLLEVGQFLLRITRRTTWSAVEPSLPYYSLPASPIND